MRRVEMRANVEHEDDVGERVRRATHLAATLLVACVVALPALRALPVLASGGPSSWVTLAPAYASALALALLPVFLALPGRGTAFLAYAAIAAIPAVFALATSSGKLVASLGFAPPTLLLGALLAAWGVAQRRAARARDLRLYA